MVTATIMFSRPEHPSNIPVTVSKLKRTMLKRKNLNRQERTFKNNLFFFSFIFIHHSITLKLGMNPSLFININICYLVIK